MNTCETCKHWSNENRRGYWGGEDSKTKIRKCQRVPMFWDSTDWDEEGEDRIITSDSLAFCQDASDYRADLLTLPNFGCVMWEEK